MLAAFVDGLFVSTNAGNTFAAVALPSWPAGNLARLAVDRVKSVPTVAFAFAVKGAGAHLWRRVGATWTKLTTPAGLNINQAWYDWYVAASPNNQNQVYVGAIDAYRGSVSGSTVSWTDITTQGNNSIHPDQHCLTFAPNNPQVIYAGNDGGIFRLGNSGATWTALNKGLGITEIEYMASDPTTWKWLMAGTQDNGTIRFTGQPFGTTSPMATEAIVGSINLIRISCITRSTECPSSVQLTRETPGPGSRRRQEEGRCSTRRSRYPG